MLWANLHLLFWLSLIPFTTAYLAEQHFDLAADGALCVRSVDGRLRLFPAGARADRRTWTGSPNLWRGLATGLKDKISVAAYLLALAAAFLAPWVSGVLIIAVALIWIVPDRRFSRAA